MNSTARKKIVDQITTPKYTSDNSSEIAPVIISAAIQAGYGFCNNHGIVYFFNGKNWEVIDNHDLSIFLKASLIKHFGNQYKGSERKRIDELQKQFPYSLLGGIPNESRNKINFKNGILDLDSGQLSPHTPMEFFRYTLPYEYDPKAKCPMFEAYLRDVIEEEEERMVIAEYLGYLYTDLKLEKVLFLYGKGLNGKSVLMEIIEALIGSENVSHESLSDMCGQNGANSRANLVGKTLNSCSDVSADSFHGDVFKRLASGEPISVKILYSDVFSTRDYARLIFCLNELPHTSDTSNGYFRRFLIAPFLKQIPKHKINPNLAQQIIDNELPGIMNWVIEGRKRLLQQKKFTDSTVMEDAWNDYRYQYNNKKEEDGIKLILPSFYK